MAINYNPIEIKGVAAEPIIEEILFENLTIADGLVTFEDNVKAETIFTEANATATMQAYTSGAPSASGSLGAFDAIVTPAKVMFYDEFDPNTLRFSRFKRDMKQGAWETVSGEFERIVIGGLYAKQVSLDAEYKFWNGVKSTTKTAIAGLTGSSGINAKEQAVVASQTSTFFDGVITKMIYNDSNASHTAQVGGRVFVSGTTVSATNIKEEYDKLYAAIPAEVLAGSLSAPYMYVPRSHKQMINIYNNTPTNYKDAFSVSDDKKTYFFNGIEIKFVPVPEKVMLCARKEHLFWCTDLQGDINNIKIDKIAANREDMFMKHILTIDSHVANQKFNVLYVG